MKTVVFQGPALTQSGYGVHSRQVIKWLLKDAQCHLKVIATPWGDTPWLLNPGDQEGLVGEIMSRAVSPEAATGADVSFQLQLPNEWSPGLAKVNVGITAAVEADRCHPSWINACNAMDVVITPSKHAASSIENTGKLNKPIVIVPESFPENMKQRCEPLELSLSTGFNFLLFGQITGNNPHNDRKNTFFAIKWLCEAFHDDKDVGVVVKTNAGRNTKIDRNIVTNMLKQLIAEVRKGPYPRIHLLHGDMNDADVAGLYRNDSIKALVALTRGEGFGLPILEAAASDLPVVATGWSGHTEFLPRGKYVDVTYQVADVHPSRIDDKIFVKGARWAHPSEDDAKRKLKKLRSSIDIPKKWAAETGEKVRLTHSFESICKAYEAAVGSLLD